MFARALSNLQNVFRAPFRGGAAPATTTAPLLGDAHVVEGGEGLPHSPRLPRIPRGDDAAASPHMATAAPTARPNAHGLPFLPIAASEDPATLTTIFAHHPEANQPPKSYASRLASLTRDARIAKIKKKMFEVIWITSIFVILSAIGFMFFCGHFPALLPLIIAKSVWCTVLGPCIVFVASCLLALAGYIFYRVYESREEWLLIKCENLKSHEEVIAEIIELLKKIATHSQEEATIHARLTELYRNPETVHVLNQALSWKDQQHLNSASELQELAIVYTWEYIFADDVHKPQALWFAVTTYIALFQALGECTNRNDDGVDEEHVITVPKTIRYTDDSHHSRTRTIALERYCFSAHALQSREFAQMIALHHAWTPEVTAALWGRYDSNPAHDRYCFPPLIVDEGLRLVVPPPASPVS